MDKAILGCGEARCSGIATLPELRAFPAPALSDLYPVRLDRPEIRAGARFGDDQRLHDHYHTGDKRFASAVPYASIIVELDDAPGALLAGNLLGVPFTEAKVGRRVEVVFEKLNDDITLPQFRLARTDPAE